MSASATQDGHKQTAARNPDLLQSTCSRLSCEANSQTRDRSHEIPPVHTPLHAVRLLDHRVGTFILDEDEDYLFGQLVDWDLTARLTKIRSCRACKIHFTNGRPTYLLDAATLGGAYNREGASQYICTVT